MSETGRLTEAERERLARIAFRAYVAYPTDADPPWAGFDPERKEGWGDVAQAVAAAVLPPDHVAVKRSDLTMAAAVLREIRADLVSSTPAWREVIETEHLDRWVLGLDAALKKIDSLPEPPS